MSGWLLLLVLLAAAEDPPSETAWQRMLDSRAQVRRWLERQARAVTDRAAAEIASQETWEPLRARRREELRDMLGLLPWPERSPLNPQITGRLDRGSYVVEKLAFESLPKIYVTANLYLPKPMSGPVPGIVYVCGHSYSPYGAKVRYQRHGISLAKNGYVALILDPIQIAETFGLHHGVYSQEMYDWYSRGYTPAGVEVWNAIRAVDYLETRSEVDKNRIGMTGRSGGAAMSWFTAAVDDRIRAVAPIMGIGTYAAMVQEDTQRRHCDCMFPINFARQDLLHLGALIAPRPLLTAHGRKDALFPVPGYEEFERRIGALYRSYGRPDDFRNVVVEAGHEDSDFLREQAIRWFDQHLLGVADRPLDLTYTEEPPENLAVFGGRPPADAENYRIHERFTLRPAAWPFPSPAAWQARRKALLEQLETKVLAAVERRPRNVRWSRSAAAPDGRVQELVISTEEDISLRALLYRPEAAADALPSLLYVASDGEDRAAIEALLLGVTRRGRAAWMAVYPRGIGEVPWEKTFWKSVLRNAMFVGHTVDSLRLADVLAAFHVLRLQDGVDPRRITVAGKGASGILGLYAALLEPAVGQVILIEPPSSHREAPLFLGVLRYTDLPEAAGLLAPRRLNFYGHMHPAYETTRSIYGLFGAAGHVFVTMSLEAVLEGRYDHHFASGL
ncbi:MAG: alpha/beta hydrolase [Bryobacterales bacterium]|nr:alpha/beta hydrolase [Bryobacterales bacterium]